ncbi:MAG: XdhC/CoxF family protein, partial [Actinobacteria bacterium]|nr:XdhC/CoxF family protein [Actinomycetota bacterium]
ANEPTVVKYELVDPADGHAGVCGGEAEIYLEPYMPKPTILVIGAGHVGRAVCGLASWLNFRTVVWDDRPAAADGVEDADAKLSGSLTDALSQHEVTAETSVVMVTRNVALDLEILPVLFDTPAKYIGLMGSTRRWETTREGLVKLGIGDDQIARVQAPIGIEIKAETPEEIAVSIIAEVIGSRNGA